MAPFTIKCSCGERYHVDDAQRGRHVVCRGCGARIEIARPAESRKEDSPKTRAGVSREVEPAREHQADRIDGSGDDPTDGALAGRRGPRLGIPRGRGGRRRCCCGGWATGRRSAACCSSWVAGCSCCRLVVLVPAVAWLRRGSSCRWRLGAVVVLGPDHGIPHRLAAAASRARGRSRCASCRSTPRVGDVAAQILPLMLDAWEAQIVAFQECGDELAARREPHLRAGTSTRARPLLAQPVSRSGGRGDGPQRARPDQAERVEGASAARATSCGSCSTAAGPDPRREPPPRDAAQGIRGADDGRPAAHAR